MARLYLITGGCRSGKSRHAQDLAESLPGAHTYLATCQRTDDEMARRIDRHRRGRDAALWTTVEEPRDLAGSLRRIPAGVVLVDCLTLWVNNLMWDGDAASRALDEDGVAQAARDAVAAARARDGHAVFVTNEVGFGIVPDNEAARRYRDLIGRCNQTVAAAADVVVLVVCGVPLYLKGGT